jgi:hypothetical protein
LQFNLLLLIANIGYTKFPSEECRLILQITVRISGISWPSDSCCVTLKIYLKIFIPQAIE